LTSTRLTADNNVKINRNTISGDVTATSTTIISDNTINGTTWSSVYRLGGMAVEGAFVYGDKLWVYSSQGTSDGDRMKLRSFTATG